MHLGQVTHFRAGRIYASPGVLRSGRPLGFSRLSLSGLLRPCSRTVSAIPPAISATLMIGDTPSLNGLHSDAISGFNFPSSRRGESARAGM